VLSPEGVTLEASWDGVIRALIIIEGKNGKSFIITAQAGGVVRQAGRDPARSLSRDQSITAAQREGRKMRRVFSP